jgi:hypothetical protein
VAFKTYAQYIEVGPIESGVPTSIHGRIVRFLGPLDLEYCLDVDGRPEHGEILSMGITRRRWLCIYPIERTYDFSRKSPGQYVVAIIGAHAREKAPRDAAVTITVPERR